MQDIGTFYIVSSFSLSVNTLVFHIITIIIFINIIMPTQSLISTLQPL